jgi:hypothetical protein
MIPQGKLNDGRGRGSSKANQDQLGRDHVLKVF